MASAKVCISNLDYHTSEDELRDYLGGYPSVKDVFIPNYPLSYGYHRRKPLGIAYASLESQDDADWLANELKGKVFRERKLAARVHVPYTPTAKPSKQSKEGTVHFNPMSPMAAECDHDKEISFDTVHIRGLKGKVNEALLQEFFKDYNPTFIKIMRIKWRRSLKVPLFYTALVTFDLEEGKSTDEVIEALDGQKCGLGVVRITKAFLKDRNSASMLKSSDNPMSPVEEEEKKEAPGQICNSASGEAETDQAEQLPEPQLPVIELGSPMFDSESLPIELKSGTTEFESPEPMAELDKPEVESVNPEVTSSV